jgi:hypothetical protein
MISLKQHENSPPAKEGWPKGPGWFEFKKTPLAGYVCPQGTPPWQGESLMEQAPSVVPKFTP